jgi:hypothetical protein
MGPGTFDGPARAFRCACAIRDEVHPLGLAIRAGLHSGRSNSKTTTPRSINLCASRWGSSRVTAEVLLGAVMVRRRSVVRSRDVFG